MAAVLDARRARVATMTNQGVKMFMLLRIAVLTASLFAALFSSAGAVTWHNSGDTAFTATAGIGTLATTGSTLWCSASQMRGTTGTSPFAGATWTAAQLTGTYGGCTLAGQNVTVDCGYAFTASSQSGGVTSGSIDTTCSVFIVGILICKIEGTQPGTYTNPSGTTGAFTLAKTTALRATNGTTGATPLPCPLGASQVDTPHRIFTITNATGGATAPHTGPVLTRTA